MSKTLTSRQAEVLRYIVTHVLEHGYQPTYREIAEHLQLSSHSGVAGFIRGLRAQGLVGEYHGPRALDLRPSMKEAIS